MTTLRSWTGAIVLQEPARARPARIGLGVIELNRNALKGKLCGNVIQLRIHHEQAGQSLRDQFGVLLGGDTRHKERLVGSARLSPVALKGSIDHLWKTFSAIEHQP